ncbi:carboxymuconolactone decarboxylase family protein [Jannaschia ovalis]|uniref:Carboxymuconolactone decarboxylase family protein n=1 Tax=Jannaschia ovalis TaxID=3038773 RepID=A0ABY8LBT2_9RHOB|nr:carboxymuconolactone decarboxylase family protein [Jannaschia sp. GRR-S6-38]WGH78077.1 carboxymuconolactone decarboxylase family protein [Jannaschia sp. GRR-S6-38]
MTDERRERGERRRREVLGDAHVDRSQADPAGLDAKFVDLTTASAWGTVWASDALPLRERSMITLAILAATASWEEFELHLRATANTGATPGDIVEVVQHVGIYAGIPRANTAIKIAKRILAEMEG